MVYFTDFEVTGHGWFPYDMLRYDQCYPIDTASAQSMEVAEDLRYSPTLRIIKLRAIHSSKQWEPTAARWNSFGWGVTKTEPARKWA